MHVALHVASRVPPLAYGGTERVVYWLGVALQRLGHRVTLLAPEGSRIPGAGFVPWQPGERLAELVPDDVDVLHLREPPRSDPGKPFLVTQDGNGVPGDTFHPNTVFVSRKHAENHSSGQFVHNGIDPDEYESQATRGDYAVFLANAAWDVKNVRGAVQVARAAGVRLEVIGGMDLRLRVERWLPHMRGVRWRGSLDEASKRRLLQRARALVFPVRWHEPFGVAVLEALASGCPVLATPYGALPEIVTPEVGVLSARGRELAEALRQADGFSPEACRARVQDRFTHLHMARAYVRHYESLLKTGRVADADPAPPSTQPWFAFNQLLPWMPP